MLAISLNDVVGFPPWIGVPLFVALLIGVRYALFAGGALLLLTAFAGPLRSRRIQPQAFTRAQLLREAGYSALSILVFAAVFAATFALEARFDFLQIYRDVGDHGWAWLVASVPIAILIHDLYFYWAHRFMHLPGVFERVHKVHHLSTNPSPLSAFAFHPVEAMIEASAIVVIAVLMPIHPLALIAVGLYSIVTNVMGHAGYELLPRGLADHRLLGWLNTATSHNQHHRTFGYNFGLYTLIWDRLFGTLHPQYRALYARVTAAPDCAPPAEALKEPS
jgi:sterol desaturase/sphingolipid hydroxylase (fatty acid hydroxylase superfamily)